MLEMLYDTYSYPFRRESSLMYQLLMFPFMKPERITNSNTRMLTAVKTLFTMADSFTPNARIPRKKTHKKYKVYHDCENSQALFSKNWKILNIYQQYNVIILHFFPSFLHIHFNDKLDHETCLPRALWDQLQRSLGRELIQVNPSQPVCPESWQWHFQWGHRRSHSMLWLHSMFLKNSKQAGGKKANFSKRLVNVFSLC